MTIKTTPFNPFDLLQSQNEINDLLLECYQDDDPRTFITALGMLARHHGMTDVAKAAGLTRASLYKTFDGKTQPKWDSIQRVLKVLGVNMTIAA